MLKNDMFKTFIGIIIYKQQFLHSDWLRTRQLIPHQCNKVKLVVQDGEIVND